MRNFVLLAVLAGFVLLGALAVFNSELTSKSA